MSVMDRKRHKTNRYRRLIIAGCALLLFSLASVFSIDAAERPACKSTMRSQLAVSTPKITPTPSASPVPTRSTEAKRPNPVRKFFSWIARGVTRVFRKPEPFRCELPPTVTVSASTSSITFCPTDQRPSSNLTCSPNREVSLAANAPAPDGVHLLFTWNVTAGDLKGEGRSVTWDLSGVPEGTYTATVEVNDGNQHTAAATTSVRIALCSGCERPIVPCPSIMVSCPDAVDAKQPITFQANVSGGDKESKPTYTWTVSAGRIISGQGTPKITVDISNLNGRSVTATVSVGGMDPACAGTASCSIIDY